MTTMLVFVLFLAIFCTIITDGAVLQIPLSTPPSGEMERPKNVYKTKINGGQKSDQLTMSTNNTTGNNKIYK